MKKCFIINRDGEYVIMYVKQELLASFYIDHGHQIIVEANDMGDAIQQFAALRR